jgi:hypothetical protein
MKHAWERANADSTLVAKIVWYRPLCIDVRKINTDI